MAIRFTQTQVKFSLSNRNLIKQFILQEFKKIGRKELDALYIFCDNKTILEINKAFLKHDYFTDIITFPLEETNKKVTAEIYISIETVKENAQDFKVPFTQEMLRVIFHGALHLAGLKDKTNTEKKAMRTAENEWLENYSMYLKKFK